MMLCSERKRAMVKWNVGTRWADTILLCVLSGLLGFFAGVHHGVEEAMDVLEEEAMQRKFVAPHYTEMPVCVECKEA